MKTDATVALLLPMIVFLCLMLGARVRVAEIADKNVEAATR